MSDLENAAEEVLRAMRTLDAHRHDGAPTLEREYRRALEAYFVAAERAMGRDAAREALEDEGDETDELALEDEGGETGAGLDAIRGHYAAARGALRLARAYGSEPRTSGRRERECVEAALRHREAIRAIRMRLRPAAQQLLLPGLAKTRVPGEVGRVVAAARTA